MSSPETVTILGAGAMGSALSTPAIDNGHDVRLWGTWLDDELLDAVQDGRPHPRTNVPVDPKVRTYRSDQIAEALHGATYVVLAISSDGVMDVLRHVTAHLRDNQILAITTKGFVCEVPGDITLLPAAIKRALFQAGLSLPLVAIGGPCKANEVAARRPTAAVHAANSPAVAQRSSALFTTPAYAAEVSDDPNGVEVAAAMKNVYAIALGACQGLAESGGQPYHDLQASAFAQAVTEMIRLAGVFGGRADTVTGLAGVGDLEVTGLSGRNRVYGTRIGAGQSPDTALRQMREAGQTVEGVPAAGLAGELVDTLVTTSTLPGWHVFPLLETITALLTESPAKHSAESLAALLAQGVLPGPAPVLAPAHRP